MSANDEFYVGYLPAPPDLGRRLRRLALAVLFLAPPAGILVAMAHTPSAGGTFEYGHPMTVRGELEWRPLPALRVREGQAVRHVALVAQGKHGVEGWEAMDGHPVAVSVTRIHRDRDEMFEVASPPTLDTLAAALPSAVVEALGAVTFRGEIVDGKCDLGVMNPGNGTLHRGCAVRCLSGGVPPMLLLRDREGREARVALAGRDAPLPGGLVRRWAGAIVEVRGTLVRRDGAPILLLDDSTAVRIP
jgi:hypothetical protein